MNEFDILSIGTFSFFLLFWGLFFCFALIVGKDKSGFSLGISFFSIFLYFLLPGERGR